MPTFVVPAKGIGRTDYSQEVSQGQIRPGLTLKYEQELTSWGCSFSSLASPFPNVVVPLAPGTTAHLIDLQTGLALPITLPAGFIYTVVQVSHSMNQDFRLLVYWDTLFAGYFGTSEGGHPLDSVGVVAFTSATIDPTGLTAHIIDIQIENIGGGDLSGGISMFGIIEAVGTPPFPTVKTARCKYCTYQWQVPRSTTVVVCPSCGKTLVFYDLSHLRRTT